MKHRYQGLASYDTAITAYVLKDRIKDIPDDAKVLVSQGQVWAEWEEKPPFEIRVGTNGKTYIYDWKHEQIIASNFRDENTAEEVCEFLNSKMP